MSILCHECSASGVYSGAELQHVRHASALWHKQVSPSREKPILQKSPLKSNSTDC